MGEGWVMDESSTSSSLEHRRLLAADLLIRGVGVCEVARKAKLSVPTVSKYKALLERAGAHTITELRIRGQRPRLDDEQQNWLISAIKHSPKVHEFECDAWKVDDLCVLIKRQFGIDYSRSHIGRFVRDRGLAYRLPRADARAARIASEQRTPGQARVAKRKAAIDLLLAGESAELIAQKLNLSKATVSKYVSVIGGWWSQCTPGHDICRPSYSPGRASVGMVDGRFAAGAV
jgi:transposase